MRACRVIERMPTNVNWILGSLKPAQEESSGGEGGDCCCCHGWCGVVEAKSESGYKR